MKKILVSIFAGITLLFGALSTSAIAGVGFGLSLNGAALETHGEEVLKSSGEVTKKKVREVAGWPEGYIQFDILDTGLVIGASYNPLSAELGASEKLRNHITGEPNLYTAVTNKAQAELKDHWKLYIETPGVFGGIYATAAWSQVTLETNETLGTGAAYGNDDVNGYSVGLGFKHRFGDGQSGGFLFKSELSYTDYKQLELKGSADSAGDQSTVRAEPEVYGFKMSLGYQF